MFSLMIPRRHRSAALPALPEVDRLFDELWRGFGVAPRAVAPAFQPRIDLRETDAEIAITAELPGLEDKDFEVSIEADVLTLKGEKRTDSETTREGWRHVETTSGSFERRILLPEGVDPEAVKAVYKHGVLTVTVPKPAAAQTVVRTVPITTA
jgi:HSP20 family protein